MPVFELVAAIVLGVGVIVLAPLCLRQRRVIRRLREAADSLSSARNETEAVVHERERIYRDLHDDIGGRLLTLAHGDHDPAVSALARDVLHDLRAVVSSTQSAEGTLLEILAQIHDEMEQRLETMGVTLIWQQAPNVPDPQLPEADALHLYRIAREAISNSVRHAHASRIRIRVSATGPLLLMDFTDDGEGIPQERIGKGRGTSNMRKRAEELHGDIDWNPGTEGGTKVVLRVPIPPSEGSSAAPPQAMIRS
ncbi:ATP-binding protein [uncultured Abyssibacter sp.]|uniref:sensor histidine kinase n=1 Tax=uncultured Abyssibacter sp. TaxID=2320202 RepID=UPI0032B1E764